MLLFLFWLLFGSTHWQYISIRVMVTSLLMAASGQFCSWDSDTGKCGGMCITNSCVNLHLYSQNSVEVRDPQHNQSIDSSQE